MSDGKRYAKVGDLVIHKRSGEMGRVAEVHPPNEYTIAGKPVSCPVVVLENGTPFLDVPGKTLFDFLPERAELFGIRVRCRFDVAIGKILEDARASEISERDAMLIIGSAIRERMRKES